MQASDVASPARPAALRTPGSREPLLDGPTRDLCSAVADGALAPVRLAVVAPGGYGKTAVLHQVARRVEARGGTVAWFGQQDLGTAELILADDAHEADETALAELYERTGDEVTGLVIAARPWPRPPALNRVLSRLRGQVVLRPLDTRRVAALLGRERAGLAELVRAQTLGVPGFVVRLAEALRTEPAAAVRPDATGLPPSVLAEFRPDLDRLPRDLLSLLLAATSGAGLDVNLLAGVLGTDHDGVARAVDAARACGLLTHDGTPLPLVSQALRVLVPEERRLAVSHRLVRLQLDREGPVLDLVRPLLGSELGGAELAEAFEAAADEAAEDDPALAATLYAAATRAGRSPTALGCRWAEVAARSGDLDTALRLADQVIADPDAEGRAHAAGTAATAFVHKGQNERAREMYRWSATRLSHLNAALVAVRDGGLAEAEALLDTAASGSAQGEPPTLVTGAMSALVRGTVESVTSEPSLALSTLADAAETLGPVGRSLFLPDTPAAVGALVGMQCGELPLAETLLQQAVETEVGGHTARSRHLLLTAWIAMLRGDTDSATRTLATVDGEPTPRDWLLSSSLRAGLARRTSDLGALRTVWADVREAVLRLRVDLFTILPLGELAIAAARLGESERLTHQLGRMRALLGALGDPPLWSATLHWSGLHAAITADRRDEAAEHAMALSRCADRLGDHTGYHRAIAEAATCWIDILGGAVDAARVEAAAGALHDTGLHWDAARLAGQAAIRTTDRAAMVSLLERARALQGGPAAGASRPAPRADPGGLSERERQVAELVVSGLTYRQVGDRLFISAKTVEHHMARMRQRLGATSRADLLDRLREFVTTS
ncbi:helix-turn-helix domain-containing protein [Saccharomonospora xinjiangensis]|uniref:Response regulator containing a CheY-like receiver domain and an HTH DNA-binding domain n=1 Tax=Saccharomonospora xinjiangensis XJ-54 TaxID=882086 RepID=I0V3B8_9PSEU|nr:helix-turn-helix transcriptional regulator [Saccharomonospora xinjiangensis]EID54621.1 response regulator containing a CheY-like receiver domain and an HTH DNA-binding domain [Saccharomonospora xinjiangensis XJ-54]